MLASKGRETFAIPDMGLGLVETMECSGMKPYDFRCETCVHWEENNRLVPAWNDMSSGRCMIDDIATRAEFGCSMWEVKVEEEPECV